MRIEAFDSNYECFKPGLRVLILCFFLSLSVLSVVCTFPLRLSFPLRVWLCGFTQRFSLGVSCIPSTAAASLCAPRLSVHVICLLCHSTALNDEVTTFQGQWNTHARVIFTGLLSSRCHCCGQLRANLHACFPRLLAYSVHLSSVYAVRQPSMLYLIWFLFFRAYLTCSIFDVSNIHNTPVLFRLAQFYSNVVGHSDINFKAFWSYWREC